MINIFIIYFNPIYSHLTLTQPIISYTNQIITFHKQGVLQTKPIIIKTQIGKQMLIEHREYIALVDQIQFLKKDNSMLKNENSIIMQQLVKAKQKIEELTELHQQNMNLIQNLHAKSLTHQFDNTKQLIQHIATTTNQTKNFIDLKYQQLQNNTLNQSKDIELKITKSNIDVYELSEFVNKIKTLRKQTTHPDNFSNHKLTYNELFKWIKCLVLFSLSQPKHQTSQSIDEPLIKMSHHKQQKLHQKESIKHYSPHSKTSKH